MMADMGYGLLMMLASVVVLTKARPQKGMHDFFALLGLCGVSTFLMGTLTGRLLWGFHPPAAEAAESGEHLRVVLAAPVHPVG